MNILVDKLPENPRECLFSIIDLDGEYANCKLKMQDEYDWREIAFNGGCCCNLSRGKECPYLKCLLDHIGVKPITVTMPDDTKENIENLKKTIYGQFGIPFPLEYDNKTIAAVKESFNWDNKKYKQHFERMQEESRATYTEPESWDDFVGNRTYKIEERF